MLENELPSHRGFVATMSSPDSYRRQERWGMAEIEGCLALQKQVMIAQQLGRKVQIQSKIPCGKVESPMETQG
jgi:hypothetical protein